MSASVLEDVLRHAPTWIEDIHEIPLPWESILNYSDFRSLELDNEPVRPNKYDATLLLSSEVSQNQQQLEPSSLSSPQRPVSCPECFREFPVRRSLRKHMRSVHSDQRLFPCQECNESFRRNYTLQRHRQARHQNIEPVECMRCGKLVKDRSLDDHLKSQACMRHMSNIEHASIYHTAAEQRSTTMLAAILEQTEDDCQIFKSFSTGSVCDPLSASSYLSYKAAQSWRTLPRHGEGPFVMQSTEAELFHLRGLTMRSIVRGLATGMMDDELDGAIRAFALTDRMLFPDNAKIHDTIVQWLDTERCHRLHQALLALKGALEQWNPVSSIMQKMVATNRTENTHAVVRKSTPTTQHLLKPHEPVMDCSSVPPIPPTRSIPDLSAAKATMQDNDHIVDNRAPLMALSKRKRKSNKPVSNRPNKQKICPIDGCGTSVVQRALARHFRQVHGDGEVYECDEDDCEKVFPRKDSFDRHKYEKHGQGSNKIECMKCGKNICPRAMAEHVRRRICQKKSSPENQNVVDDAG